ncbi:non-specific lipid transfer protein GPI-anchored 2-like isoform X1 [Dioscorea cayenensis subsp. rotundata]|uniref:Non-specific lipid transfer protein GPI-anchored 2-like isoform X1 n=1 Tax=Dioscorea cayennensis subsp. rotundata TaxID=55577 RepID=A0AB40BLS3_DIOCR|nr:non-specific lipid transfer protein GPI-anchored 2-like isoform X1 [Dioscorea cayenensis subsp. rotundata]
MAIKLHSLALFSLISLSLIFTSKAQFFSSAPLLAPSSAAKPVPAPAMEPVLPPPATVPVLSPAGAPYLEPAAAPADPCMDAYLNMTDCLTYVEAGSTVRVPDKGCCPAFASLVSNQPQCLCHILGSGDVIGFKIDTTKALTLPTACRVETPSVSLCALFGIPIPSPMSSPGPASGGQLAPAASSVIGSNPTSGPTPSGGKRNEANFKASFIGLLLGSIFIFLY